MSAPIGVEDTTAGTFFAPTGAAFACAWTLYSIPIEFPRSGAAAPLPRAPLESVTLSLRWFRIDWRSSMRYWASVLSLAASWFPSVVPQPTGLYVKVWFAAVIVVVATVALTMGLLKVGFAST